VNGARMPFDGRRANGWCFPPLEWNGLPGGRCMRDGGGEGMDSNSVCLPYTQDRETGICQAPIFGLVLKKVARGAELARMACLSGGVLPYAVRAAEGWQAA